MWTTRFGSDAAVVGRTFTAYVSDRPEEAERFTIIGVLPEQFWHFNPYTDILAPLRAPTFPYMARLRAGVSAEQAAARITALVTAGAREVPPGWTATVISSHAAYVSRLRPMLRTVGAAAALVLLVACANVAGLLLVRATRRRKEIAVRAALGAGRGAIARMLLAEALVLGAAATIVALATTSVILAWLAPLIQQRIGRPAPGGALAFAIDLRVLAFATALGLVTVTVCGLAPLAASWRPRLLGALQSGNRTATDGRGSQRVRATLIALEIAASLALLAGSTLMIRTVVTLLGTDLGFSADRVLMGSVTLRQNRYPDPASRLDVHERLLARLRSAPEVESVALATAWPLQQAGAQPIEAASATGRVAAAAAVNAIDDAYLSTLDIPLVIGRAFSREDRLGREPVAIVSDTLARRLWPGETALGKRLVVPMEQADGSEQPINRLVIGVARDVRQEPADVDLSDVYVPILQTPGRFTFVLLQTRGAPASGVSALRTALRDIDPEIAVNRPRPMQAALDEVIAGPRFLASLLGIFAMIAAALALIGAYGVIAYTVRQREREIAVRMAIGAGRAQITRLFVRQGAVVLSAGLALGVIGALAAGRLLESQLFGVTAHDPLALAGVVGAFGIAGFGAIWWPARRAAETDPAIALRSE
jgi:putative ABC transport system permease protein